MPAVRFMPIAIMKATVPTLALAAAAECTTWFVHFGQQHRSLSPVPTMPLQICTLLRLACDARMYSFAQSLLRPLHATAASSQRRFGASGLMLLDLCYGVVGPGGGRPEPFTIWHLAPSLLKAALTAAATRNQLVQQGEGFSELSRRPWIGSKTDDEFGRVANLFLANAFFHNVDRPPAQTGWPVSTRRPAWTCSSRLSVAALAASSSCARLAGLASNVNERQQVLARLAHYGCYGRCWVRRRLISQEPI
jgi:hypothetical protein